MAFVSWYQRTIQKRDNQFENSQFMDEDNRERIEIEYESE